MTLLTRRQFVSESARGAAVLALGAAFTPLSAGWWREMPSGVRVAREPFGTLERIAEGVWALVSNPLGGDRTTLSNGGLIAGRSALLAVEGFNQPQGAAWLAARARELTRRWPTHVLLTHYHADHTNGVAGYVTADERPVVLATATTRDLVLQKNQPPDEARSAVLAAATMLSTSEPTTLDLGGRSVRIIPRAGHTASDVWLEVADAGVVFCGDLVWNAMFPNYVDALPTQLAASVRALRRDSDTLYVPGHGAPGRTAEFDRYVAMLDEVERAARKAHAAGVSPADAAAAFTLPPSLGEWTLLGRTFFERAFAAWYRELP